MFGDDEEDEEETEEQKAATKARVERMETARRLKEAKDAKDGKVAKAKPVEKSLVVLEVKPWEADTDVSDFHVHVTFQVTSLRIFCGP